MLNLMNVFIINIINKNTGFYFCMDWPGSYLYWLSIDRWHIYPIFFINAFLVRNHGRKPAHCVGRYLGAKPRSCAFCESDNASTGSATEVGKNACTVRMHNTCKRARMYKYTCA